MKRLLLTAIAAIMPLAAQAADIVVPDGFSATVVFDGAGPARHIAVNRRGDVYISSRRAATAPTGSPPAGILALRDTDGDGKLDKTERFSDVEGTGLRFDGDDLYATSDTTLYRFHFETGELVPSKPAEVVVSGMPSGGFPSRGVAFDGRGGVFLTIGGGGNACMDRSSAEPKGANPCPDLPTRAGIWKYSTARLNQQHPTDGERFATGVRDMMAVDWSGADRALFAVMQGRNGLANAGAKSFTRDDDALGVAEEMHRIRKGADLGWPYTHFDGRTMKRIKAPEYGGAPNDTVEDKTYSTPVAVLPPHSSPLDLAVYRGRQFPASYRGGAFVALQGGMGADRPQNGYQVWFVPKPPASGFASPRVFADGFAGGSTQPGKAEHRPSGVAVGPDGSLYIVDAKTGRVWRIQYRGGKASKGG